VNLRENGRKRAKANQRVECLSCPHRAIRNATPTKGDAERSRSLAESPRFHNCCCFQFIRGPFVAQIVADINEKSLFLAGRVRGRSEKGCEGADRMKGTHLVSCDGRSQKRHERRIEYMGARSENKNASEGSASIASSMRRSCCETCEHSNFCALRVGSPCYPMGSGNREALCWPALLLYAGEGQCR
jgi:hypothetical protein